jgi:hypothetical protein
VKCQSFKIYQFKSSDCAPARSIAALEVWVIRIL